MRKCCPQVLLLLLFIAVILVQASVPQVQVQKDVQLVGTLNCQIFTF